MRSFEKKWISLAALMVVVFAALSLNQVLFSQSGVNVAGGEGSGTRSIASVVSSTGKQLENKAFALLRKTNSRQLANVGRSPSAIDSFAFGDLGGGYSVRSIDGAITAVELSAGSRSKPIPLANLDEFLTKNLSLFSQKAQVINKIHEEENGEMLIEKYQMLDQSGHLLGHIQVLLDEKENLISMTVQ